MSTILAQLSNRSVPALQREPVEDIDLIHYYVESQNQELTAAFAAHEAISNLAGQFFTEGVEITEREAQLYQVSVESIMIAAGLPLPASILAPSFESSATYSVEADDKKIGVLARIWAWIKEAGAALMERIRKMLGMRYHQSIEISKTIEGMLADLERLTDDKVKPFHMEGTYYNGFDLTGKFDLSANEITANTVKAKLVIQHLIDLQQKVMKADTGETYDSSEDVYYSVGWARKETLKFLGDNTLILDPIQHTIGKVNYLFCKSTESEPLPLMNIKTALKCLKSYNDSMKIEFDLITGIAKSFEARLASMDAQYKAVVKEAGDKLDQVRRTANALHAFGDDAEERKKSMMDRARKEYDDTLKKFSAFKYIFNAFNKVAVTHNTVITDLTRYSTDVLKILRSCMGCYHVYEKAPKK